MVELASKLRWPLPGISPPSSHLTPETKLNQVQMPPHRRWGAAERSWAQALQEVVLQEAPAAVWEWVEPLSSRTGRSVLPWDPAHPHLRGQSTQASSPHGNACTALSIIPRKLKSPAGPQKERGRETGQESTERRPEEETRWSRRQRSGDLTSRHASSARELSRVGSLQLWLHVGAAGRALRGPLD